MGGKGSGRTGPRRRLAGFRISDEAFDWLDKRAEDEELIKPDGSPNRSELMRIMFAYASVNMPKDWRPK
jgi:hypothetical protein